MTRSKSIFSEYQWRFGQSFCLVGTCKASHDGRSLRMKALNADPDSQRIKGEKPMIGKFNATLNSNAERECVKGEKRKIGEKNSADNPTFNKNSERQRSKGRKREMGALNATFNGNSERQRIKGEKRRLDLDNLLHNCSNLAADKGVWLSDPLRAQRNSVLKQRAGQKRAEKGGIEQYTAMGVDDLQRRNNDFAAQSASGKQVIDRAPLSSAAGEQKLKELNQEPHHQRLGFRKRQASVARRGEDAKRSARLMTLAQQL